MEGNRSEHTENAQRNPPDAIQPSLGLLSKRQPRQATDRSEHSSGHREETWRTRAPGHHPDTRARPELGARRAATGCVHRPHRDHGLDEQRQHLGLLRLTRAHGAQSPHGSASGGARHRRPNFRQSSQHDRIEGFGGSRSELVGRDETRRR